MTVLAAIITAATGCLANNASNDTRCCNFSDIVSIDVDVVVLLGNRRATTVV